MAGNRIVAHFGDGRLLKGTTADFFPARDVFHVESTGPGVAPVAVRLADLKALFFVKELAGNPGHRKTNAFPAGRPVQGRKLRVVFRDGEELVGTTQGYAPGRPGFFLVPADPESNNVRCYVVTAATERVELL